MFKLLVALSLFVAIQGQIGGFTNRPDLVKDPTTQDMVRLATNELAKSQNLRVTPVNVVSVGTQVVNGVNYLVVFTARPLSGVRVYTCTAKVYQSFSGVQSVSSVNCV
jgi:hypothetical protein